jgi:hypothetical protein
MVLLHLAPSNLLVGTVVSHISSLVELHQRDAVMDTGTPVSVRNVTMATLPMVMDAQ